MIATFFGLWDQKNRAFCQKVFFRVLTLRIRASSEIFTGKMISFSKKFFISVTICGVWVIPLSFLQISLTKCVKPPINVWREKNWGNYPSKYLFFFFFNHFWVLSWKNLDFQQNRRQDSRNCSLQVQKNFFRKFSGSKNIAMKVFGHWMEASDFRWKCFLRVVEGTVHVSSTTLWENDDKRKLYFLWLV